MSVARVCALSCVVAAGAGCVVMPTGVYYRPSYPGVRPYSVLCGQEGTFGGLDSVHIPAPGGVTINATKIVNTSRGYRATFLVVRAINPHAVRIGLTPEPFTLENGGRTLGLDPVYTGYEGTWSLERELSDVSGDFTVRIPGMTIDGRWFQPERVRFELRRHDWAIYPFNC